MERESTDGLQKARQAYLPVLPQLLRNPLGLRWIQNCEETQEDAQIKALFPLTSGQPFLKGETGERRSPKPLQIGVVLSGGQASGGHNVITGIYDCISQLHSHSRLFGFLDGPGGIIAGKSRGLSSEM